MKMMKWLAVLACSVIILAGCSKKETVKIGAQTFSEQLILAHMVGLLVKEKAGLDVKVVSDLSSTSFNHQSMLNNDVQISFRYVGTDYTGTLKIEEQPKDMESALKTLQERFKSDFQQTWFPPLGFENTYGFTVRQELADELKLETVSDLKDAAKDLSLGTDQVWLERPFDGYPAFIEKYGFEFAKTFPMEVGLVYKAVQSKDVDVVIAYTTDARLKEYNLKVLADDKKLFPPYQASVVARDDLLKKHPAVKEVIDSLEGKIDTETMTALNYQVDVKLEEPEQVAKQFLIEKGLLNG
ncbi:glycine/betaine ABC transporter substrate-binding protein [Cohnella kolymensis]|uniref:Glycine/betaine ABC transporter substrate-binding protein n=1 Tax=Cohnella kolymensis TaxID=1590652 RepID=A0ABR5A1X7_9BACL|nr:glycine betaine ABC transporter substrate-binding protein [Cohnella kolymensis]KIL34422.1 glycine/betaine ABC transporter substrate-binding protein [Cohnella kolymensis]